MSQKLEKIEVVRFETSYDDGTLDFCTENVRSLCKAFSLIFKIIDRHFDGGDVQRYYEIYISASSFLLEDIRHVIKTFILTSGMTLSHVETVKMTEDESMSLHEKAFEAGNQIVNTP